MNSSDTIFDEDRIDHHQFNVASLVHKLDDGKFAVALSSLIVPTYILDANQLEIFEVWIREIIEKEQDRYPTLYDKAQDKIFVLFMLVCIAVCIAYLLKYIDPDRMDGIFLAGFLITPVYFQISSMITHYQRAKFFPYPSAQPSWFRFRVWVNRNNLLFASMFNKYRKGMIILSIAAMSLSIILPASLISMLYFIDNSDSLIDAPNYLFDLIGIFYPVIFILFVSYIPLSQVIAQRGFQSSFDCPLTIENLYLYQTGKLDMTLQNRTTT